MTYYRGHVGGGGCLGAIYDPTRKTAEVLSQYDTAQDIVETTVVSPPIGVRHDVVAMPTHNGVALGMTARNVEAIEGRGSRSRSGDDVVIAYAWSVPVPEPSRPTGQPLAPTVTATMSPESFSLMFLLHDDRVVAIDYLYGF